MDTLQIKPSENTKKLQEANAAFYKYTGWIEFRFIDGVFEVEIDGHFQDSNTLRAIAEKLDELNKA